MQKPPSNLYTLLSLGLVLVIDALVLGIVFPIMGPLFINSTHAIVPAATSLVIRDVLYSVTMGVFSLASIIGAPFFGDLSDSLGRRKVLLISLFGTSVCCLLSAVAISIKCISLLIVTRGIAGLAAGNQPLAQAAIIDISTPDTKARNISLITLASCLGFVFGPLVGGVFSDNKLFAHASYATPFYLAALFALINCFCLLFTFRETFHPKKHKPIQFLKGFTLIIDGFKNPALRQWMKIYLCIQFAWGAYFQCVSLIMAQVDHYSTGKIGLFMAFVGLLFAGSLSTFVPYVTHRFNLRKLTMLGIVGVFVGILFSGIFLKTAEVRWIMVVPIAIGEALAFTTMLTQISNAVSKEVQGWAMGITNAVGSFAWGISALGVGAVSGWDLRLPFMLGAAFIVMALYSLFFHVRSGPHEPVQSVSE